MIIPISTKENSQLAKKKARKVAISKFGIAWTRERACTR
jgi:hypothetical protein